MANSKWQMAERISAFCFLNFCFVPMSALTSPAITQLTVESGVAHLLDEWLGQWFDGEVHGMGSEPACVWPDAERRFGQGPIAAQPLEGVEIRVLMHPRGEAAAVCDTALYQGKLITDYVTLNFWIRAKAAGAGQSQRLAQTVGQLLKGLLTYPPARAPLAVKGITHLQPQGPASVMPSADYATRLVVCAAQVQYAVTFASGMDELDQIILADSEGQCWRLVVDELGNLGAQEDPGPITGAVVLSDGMGFWRLVVDGDGLRGAEATTGPATAAPVLRSATGNWTIIVDTLGNLGTTQQSKI
jgi:hypothetical protein